MQTTSAKMNNKVGAIGLITPSSPLMPGWLEAGVEFFSGLGYTVKCGQHNAKTNRFMAGSDNQRAEDMMHFFKDDSVQALVVTGGGYGSQRLLPILDFKLIENNPKPIIGFSDTTALQLGLFSKAGLVSYTGFTCHDVHEHAINDLLKETLISCLNKQPYSVAQGQCIKPGKASGRLVGGNLGLVTALMGTPYQPDFTDCILLIEEVRQEPYKVDCMLSQLALAGVFEQVRV